jgi:hypothetical protein
LVIDFNVESTKYPVDALSTKLKYKPIYSPLISFFDDISFPFLEPIFDYGLTSANSVMKLNDFVNIKPKDFVNDLCVIGGLMINFKLNGSSEIMNVGNYFNDLLSVDIDSNPINFLAIDDIKELSIRHDIELNFASVSVGRDISTYNAYTYFYDWNKILTFKQDARNASENLDITHTKLRTDFSGIIDFLYKKSKSNIKPEKDNFIFDPSFTERDVTYWTRNIYDYFTPRDILTNWTKFLSFCFQNYGKNTLTISSNGGTTDDVSIDYKYQMDDFEIDSIPRLLPISYTFTALIDDVDFSEKILKINHNDEDVYIFVTNAETTNQLREQKITGLKIQF